MRTHKRANLNKLNAIESESYAVSLPPSFSR
jgi:hypothetical protein